MIQGTDAPFVYDSERDKEGVCQFDVPNGTYTVRVHLCETWQGGVAKGARRFGFKINGQVVAARVEIAPEYGGWTIPLIKEYKDIQVSDGKLLVEPFGNFNNNDKHAGIEGYEVVQQ